MALITLEELGNYIGETLTGDARAVAIVSAIDTWVENYTGRLFGTATGGKEVIETMDYQPVLYLSKIDIVSITELKVNDVVLTADDYRLNKNIGRLILALREAPPLTSLKGLDAVEVTYKAGLTTVPADLKIATLQLASELYNRKDKAGEGGVSSASVAGLNINFGSGVPNDTKTSPDGAHVPSSYIAILNYYRRRRV